jgi:hypothetical protein
MQCLGNIKMRYQIRYGLGGGFGGAGEWEEIEAEDLDAAEQEAYYAACETYENYSGMYGLRSVEEILEELIEVEGWEADGLDEAAEETYNEERESWLDYEAREYVAEDE